MEREMHQVLKFCKLLCVDSSVGTAETNTECVAESPIGTSNRLDALSSASRAWNSDDQTLHTFNCDKHTPRQEVEIFQQSLAWKDCRLHA